MHICEHGDFLFLVLPMSDYFQFRKPQKKFSGLNCKACAWMTDSEGQSYLVDRLTTLGELLFVVAEI